jgi:ferrous iron transport protein B
MGYRYALVGNPNCGKTTLFNALTGSNQYVGNWPGLQSKKKREDLSIPPRRFRLLTCRGFTHFLRILRKRLSAEFIIDEKPDLIINIVDATNLNEIYT